MAPTTAAAAHNMQQQQPADAAAQHTLSQSPTAQHSSADIPSAPPPPPADFVAPKPTPVAASDNRPASPKGRKDLIEVDGEQVPGALANAFNQPKDKRPFTYTPQGLSAEFVDGRKTPSEIKRVQTPTAFASPLKTLPRVLPLFSDPEADDWTDTEMPAVAHLQYNTPIGLYSAQNAQSAFQQQAAGTGAQLSTPVKAVPKEWSADKSATYRALMEDEQVQFRSQTPSAQSAPSQSARYEEQSGDEYPHYHGFQNPHYQSPSFKKLQFLTGDQHAGSYHLAEGSAAGEGEGRGYQQQAQQAQYYEQQAPRPVSATPVAQYDPTVQPVPDPQGPIDPYLAAKLAEAERPKVPAQQQPHWAVKAQQKQSKWAGQQFDNGYQQQQQQPAEQPHWGRISGGRSDRWSSHYSGIASEQGGYAYDEGVSPRARSVSRGPSAQPGYEFGGTDYSRSYLYPGLGTDNAVRLSSRARSQGPDWRAAQAYAQQEEEKEWMKPYVAQPVRDYAKQHHVTQDTGAIVSNQHLHAQYAAQRYSPAPPANNVPITSPQAGFGTYYGPPEGFRRSGHRGQGSGRNRHLGHGGLEFGTDYSALADSYYSQQQYTPTAQAVNQESYYRTYEQEQPRVEYTTQQYLSPRPVSPRPISPRPLSPRPAASPRASVPPEAQQGTDFTGYAYKATTPQPQIASPVPSNISKVSKQTYSTSAGGTSGWRRGGGGGGTVTGSRWGGASTTTNQDLGGDLKITKWKEERGPNWYMKSGGDTKASTSGEYIDADGNKVTYTKELVTTQEGPGREHSTLTEEERKVMEEPLQPGVISRHVTTKYYKKSTMTNQQTTTTSTPQVGGGQQPLAIEPPKLGAIAPGVSQF